MCFLPFILYELTSVVKSLIAVVWYELRRLDISFPTHLQNLNKMTNFRIVFCRTAPIVIVV